MVSTSESFDADVRERGRFPSDEDSTRVIGAVLSTLAAHLPQGPREELAEVLPEHRGRLLREVPPAAGTLDAKAFVATVAKRLGRVDTDYARWSVVAVLDTVAHLAGDALTRRVLAELPPGYALLFRRADPG